MTAPENDALEERVARLEARLESLQASLKHLTDALARREGVGPRPTPQRRAPAVSSKPMQPRVKELVADRGAEFWLSKIGIALVLFGVVFAFKYAVDQGWLTPAVRVAIGLLVAVTLYVLGIRFRDRQRWFSTTLLGGAVAAFYITGFAAFQLYALVSHTVAFAYMVAVSVLAFVTALKEDEAALSVIGVIGALATPFLLYTAAGSITALMSYTAIVLAATGMVYLSKGWRSLLWIAVAGAWIVLMIPVADAILRDLDRWALTGGALVAWIVFWAVPVVREGLVTVQPDRWTRPGWGPVQRSEETVQLLEWHVEVLTVVVPLFVLYYIGIVLELNSAALGWIATLGAAIYAAACWVLHLWRTDERLWYAHAASSVVLLTVALGLLLSDGWLLVAWAVEVAALHEVARRTGKRATAAGAHLLFAIVTIWLTVRLGTPVRGRVALVALPAVHDLVTIGLILLSAMVMLPGRARKPLEPLKSLPAVPTYRLLGYMALLAWLWRELSMLPNGNGLVTIAWGALGAALLVTALVRRVGFLRRLGLGTLLAVVGKLFLVDLASVEAIWRIMLFLGFGAIFLVLSYYFRDLWQDVGREPRPSGDSTA